MRFTLFACAAHVKPEDGGHGCGLDTGSRTIAFRLAVERPDRITALIIQNANANAYAEGFTPAWDPIEAYWRDPSIANREALRAVLSPEGVRDAYLTGVPDPSLLSPDAWLHDQVFPDRTLGRAAAHTRA